MDSPLISIIIPVFNAEKTIGRAVNSIINHTSLDYELLMINDGSMDNSLQKMKEFEGANSRIKIINIKNSGVSQARNLGIKRAKGKYITFLDADDYYTVNALEQIVSYLNGKTELVVFGYSVEYDNKYSTPRFPSNEDLLFTDKKGFRRFAVSLIRNEIINAPWNKIYLASYLKENKIFFPPDLNIGEDLKFNLLVIRDTKSVKIVNKALVNYSVKKGEGLVSRFRADRFEVRYKLHTELKELLVYWKIFEENQTMIERMLIRDIMAFFMDFYKKNCEFSYMEKLQVIQDIISRKEILEILTKNDVQDFSTKVIELILRTYNCRLILLAAKILNIKRVLR